MKVRGAFKSKLAALKVKESVWLKGYKTRANLGSTLAALSPRTFTTQCEVRKNGVGLVVTRSR